MIIRHCIFVYVEMGNRCPQWCEVCVNLYGMLRQNNTDGVRDISCVAANVLNATRKKGCLSFAKSTVLSNQTRLFASLAHLTTVKVSSAGDISCCPCYLFNMQAVLLLLLLLFFFFLDPGTSFPRCETLSKVCELSG